MMLACFTFLKKGVPQKTKVCDDAYEAPTIPSMMALAQGITHERLYSANEIFTVIADPY